jgi:hypothetical protein
MHSNSGTVSRLAFLKKTTAKKATVVALPLAQLVAVEVDWIKLFEGKTLDGWHKNPKRIGHCTRGK